MPNTVGNFLGNSCCESDGGRKGLGREILYLSNSSGLSISDWTDEHGVLTPRSSEDDDDRSLLLSVILTNNEWARLRTKVANTPNSNSIDN